MTVTLQENYILRRQIFDWDYEFSADQNVWRKWNNERLELQDIQKKFDKNFEVWNTVVPDSKQRKKES